MGSVFLFPLEEARADVSVPAHHNAGTDPPKRANAPVERIPNGEAFPNAAPFPTKNRETSSSSFVRHVILGVRVVRAPAEDEVRNQEYNR